MIAGYYPDLTKTNAYCYCTGTAAQSQYTTCSPGTAWDKLHYAYLSGKDSGGTKYGRDGYWGTIGGACVHAGSVGENNKQRPPYA